jgi:ABC-2 type transport system ATP-binding protein
VSAEPLPPPALGEVSLPTDGAGPPPSAVTTGDGDPAFVDDATVVAEGVSIWFGQKVAVTELSCSFGPGVTGLLGPNGAGKTTFMRSICGLLPTNQGEVRVLGLDPRQDRTVQRAVSLVPEDDAVPAALTARQLVQYTASLHGVRDRSRPEQCLATVGLLDVADRRVGGFSKGMRQRAKVAASLVTGPRVLVLDEPLNGADPVQRVALIDLFHRLGDDGNTVIVSSHVLHEVERLAARQIVIIRGRLAAAGGHRAIRDALADRPRAVLVRTPDPRRLAAELLSVEAVQGVTVDGSTVVISSLRAGELAAALPAVARRADARLREVRALDDSLESVFRELLR